MFWIPQVGSVPQLQHNMDATPNTATGASSIVADASTHTKGNYSAGELIASTNFDVYMIMLTATNTVLAGTRTDTLLDIGIGASGSETTIISNLLCGWRETYSDASPWYLPIFIPKGQRVAARVQSAIGSESVDVMIHLYGRPNIASPVFSRCDDYGVSTGTSSGTSHTPGNSGSESSFASVGATLTRDYGGVMLVVGGTTATANMNSLFYHWELAYNGGSPFICEYWSRTNSTEASNPGLPTFPVAFPLPSGTQLEVRGECSGTAQAQDIGLYLFY